jgi:thiol-disulfide isomerase/thioredoxin
MKSKSLAPRKALLFLACWCALELGPRLTGAEAATGEPEEAWKKLVAAKEGFYKLEPSSLQPQAFDRFLDAYAQKAGALADQFKDYQARYTNSPHAAEAWSEWMDLLNTAARSSARKAELEKAEQQCLADPKLEPRRREEIRSNQIDRTRDLKERERLVREVKDEFESPGWFLCHHLLDIAEWSDYPHSRDLLAQVLNLSEGKVELGSLRDQAQQLKARLDRIGRPLRLKFTALDGSEVDTDKLRGKVVLLEFWATWCPPCVAGIPQIKTAWDALHPEGFEVIALSYDTEREKLSRFVKNNALPWPQFFAPQGRDAPLIKAFGQSELPAYWLIDRGGILTDVNAHDGLERKVKALLARSSSDSLQSVGAQRAVQDATEPGGAANRSQPARSETNRTPSAAGSGR